MRCRKCGHFIVQYGVTKKWKHGDSQTTYFADLCGSTDAKNNCDGVNNDCYKPQPRKKVFN